MDNSDADFRSTGHISGTSPIPPPQTKRHPPATIASQESSYFLFFTVTYLKCSGFSQHCGNAPPDRNVKAAFLKTPATCLSPLNCRRPGISSRQGSTNAEISSTSTKSPFSLLMRYMTPSDPVIFHRTCCNNYRHKTGRQVTAEGETTPETRKNTVIILSPESGKAMPGT